MKEITGGITILIIVFIFFIRYSTPFLIDILDGNAGYGRAKDPRLIVSDPGGGATCQKQNEENNDK